MIKVYVYSDYFNLQRLELLTKLLTENGYVCEVTKNLDKINIETDIIIPSSVACQYNLFKKYYTSNIYGMLDNKKEFYDYLIKNPDLWKDTGLFIIPSYDSSYKGENIKKKFMVKHETGFSSKFNQIIEGNIYDIIKAYGSKNQIQELLEAKHIYGVSLSCKLGKILSVYTYLSEGAITAASQQNGFSAIRNIHIEFPQVRTFLKKIINKLQYNGIIELEFLIDKSNQIFIMECNPRISGSLCVPQYFNSIIKTYIKTFHDINSTEINLSK